MAEEQAPAYVSPQDPADEYLDAIDRVEADYGPYATELSDLYLGLGQTLMNSGDWEKAKDAFHRGVMVVRVNSGPNSPEQTNQLYMIANVESVLGENASADDVLHNIYFINSSYYGEQSPEMLPVLKRMYGWYLLTRPLGSESMKISDYETFIDLAEKMVDVSETVNGVDNAETAAAYRLLGESEFQAARYLTSKVSALLWDPSADISVTMRSTGILEDPTTDYYDDGRRAFSKYMRSLTANESISPQELAEALANMADWYLVLGKGTKARGLYEEGYEHLTSSEAYADLANSYMDQPKPVYFFNPYADILETELMDATDASLDISMTVTRNGDTRDIEVLNAPEGVSEETVKKILKAVRETPFRPAMKAGELVTTKDFIWQCRITPQRSAS